MFTRLTATVLVCALPIAGCSWLDADIGGYSNSGGNFSKRFYAGVAGGISRVAPDTSASSQFSLDSSASTAGSLLVGMDFAERISFEASFHDLGSATLAPPEEVSYSSFGGSALWYAIGDVDSLERRQGFGGFIRGGVNMMAHDANITLDSEDNVQLMVGLGADYMMSNNLTVRGEFTAHDTDAQAAQLGLVYRFGSARTSGPSVSRPSTGGKQVPDSRLPVPEPYKPEPRTEPTPPTPTVQPPVTQPTVPTPQPVPQTPVQPSSVLLASGILQGVEFASGTAQMTSSSLIILDRLAAELQASPGTRVELQSHTDGVAGADRSMQISRARVSRVGKYLLSRGVSPSQLAARAFGANRPITASTGSAINNRIELRLLR